MKALNHKKAYSGPYHGYDGFAIFARDMDLAINNPSWKLIGTPWKKEKANATVKAAA
ncbi:nitrogenase molybdenum-iron protein subunit alpha [Plectonema cf. radiosum LEGE 06105]|uniref:Nitrogenase molybdenum-iron protein subunit alpha n=1 Tax=Plectonema cf. radiosum LEGE 06105 TaxID=945769 RepID=A0A8J7F1K3_9CYAN|nr:nitrogenase molybdenum-iron protein subunit alpha [Plectonema radiosum]MBE9212985.1 nitrogenase molybdenum-iron protein subunit alpha [Plectonema cf. radiosum LEGE 06105]